MRSVPPPGAAGTTIRTGFVGQSAAVTGTANYE